MAKAKPDDIPKKRRRPAASLESRENELISLATDLAEHQLREGTASPSVISHFLKLGTTREILEKQKLQKENELLKAKAEALESNKRVEELYADAIAAMRSYGMSRSEDGFFED